jgi:hypothetical protein
LRRASWIEHETFGVGIGIGIGLERFVIVSIPMPTPIVQPRCEAVSLTRYGNFAVENRFFGLFRLVMAIICRYYTSQRQSAVSLKE